MAAAPGQFIALQASNALKETISGYDTLNKLIFDLILLMSSMTNGYDKYFYCRLLYTAYNPQGNPFSI